MLPFDYKISISKYDFRDYLRGMRSARTTRDELISKWSLRDWMENYILRSLEKLYARVEFEDEIKYKYKLFKITKKVRIWTSYELSEDTKYNARRKLKVKVEHLLKNTGAKKSEEGEMYHFDLRNSHLFVWFFSWSEYYVYQFPRTYFTFAIRDKNTEYVLSEVI
jgi:hypothetical protein